MSRFDPVTLPEERKLDGRASQTFLRHASRCPRSAYLYLRYKGEAQNDAMIRGSAAHAIIERSVNHAVEHGEQTIPPEIVRDVLAEVLAEYAVPFEEHDMLRELTYRWASQWTLEPGNVIAVEQLYTLEVGGWQVRCKVDFAEDREEGLYVADWKTGRGAFSYEDIARKRADGTMLPRTFQLVLYALAVTYGKRVLVENDIETIVQENRRKPRDVIAEYVYPAIEDSEGRMLRRTMGLTPLELVENLESVAGLLNRVADYQETGDWPAIVSGPGCAECPAPSECPIPEALRDHNGTVTSVEHAAELLEMNDRISEESRKRRAVVKAFAKEHDVEIPFGVDKVARFVPYETEAVDKGALRRAAEAGVPVDYDEIVTTKNGTNFKDCKLSAAELEEGSDGG